jgi:hypothetical protein
MASLTQMPICPTGTGSASPTSAVPRPMPSPSRLIRATAGRAGSSCSGTKRCVARRFTPGQLRDLPHQFGWEVNRVGCPGAHGRAHVQIRRQHHVQPVRHRVPKASHHHREGHGQAQRGHDPADGYCSALAHAARAFHREQGQKSARDPRGQPVISQADQPGQGRDATHQQQPDRHIGRQRECPPPAGSVPAARRAAISSRGTARCCPD